MTEPWAFVSQEIMKTVWMWDFNEKTPLYIESIIVMQFDWLSVSE